MPKITLPYAHEGRSIFGMTVKVDYSGALPRDVTPAEEAKRTVRHGMKDVLKWLGEDVGPKPDAVTQAVVFTNARGYADEILMSPDCYATLWRSLMLGQTPQDSMDALAPIHRARVESQKARSEGFVYDAAGDVRQDRLDWAMHLLTAAIKKRHAAERKARANWIEDNLGHELTDWQKLWLLEFGSVALNVGRLRPRDHFTLFTNPA